MNFSLVETASDPLAVFASWFDEAKTSELNDPNAVALATATLRGVPSVRMVLVKRVDERGFCFFTNVESRKGIELVENQKESVVGRKALADKTKGSCPGDASALC